jgi:hypothetical protein
MVQQRLIIDLLVKIARINLKNALEPTSRVSMRQVQNVVGRIRVFGCGEFLVNIRNAILFEMVHQSFVSDENAIDIEEE